MNGSTLLDIPSLRSQVRENPIWIAPEGRLQLVREIAGGLACGEIACTPHLRDLLLSLAHDECWPVRLEVAQCASLLDAASCESLVDVLIGDTNSYVRAHARRSDQKVRQAIRHEKQRGTRLRGFAGRLDRIRRKHGNEVAAEILQLADEHLSLICGGVVHDLRSSLATLQAHATRARKETPDHSALTAILEYVDRIAASVTHMETYTSCLSLEYRYEPLQSLITESVQSARDSLGRQGLDPQAVRVITRRIPALDIWVSRHEIVLALTNVIVNAMESFQRSGDDKLTQGRIDVEAVIDGYETRLIISDDGPGIDPVILKGLRAFAPSGRNRTKRTSSGWGLTLVHKYVTAHGGSVMIDSQPDGGTTVTIRLPMREEVDGDARWMCS